VAANDTASVAGLVRDAMLPHVGLQLESPLRRISYDGWWKVAHVILDLAIINDDSSRY